MGLPSLRHGDQPFAPSHRVHLSCRNEWEIDLHELDIGEQLGAGGHGQVFKGMWKGTEVAVKMMTTENVTRDMEKNFREEVLTLIQFRLPLLW